jgi:peptidoglycan/xylan/chitin deacetylase (PgdA/CDA1 family)
LDYLKQQGYYTITFNQLFDALYYGGPLPHHPIILTFDDGYDDVYHFALPILQAHGYSGMFYIITGKVGWAAYLNWKQIRTMLAEGMQIGSHTVHHVDMGSLLMYSTALAQHELQASQTVLQNHLGIVIQQFCYPSGEPFRHGTLSAQQQIVSLLAADGYIGATTDPGISGTIQHSLSPFVLLRIRVDGRSTQQFFIHTLPW